MEDKISNLTYGVICILVMVVLVATVAIPVIEDAKEAQITVAQNSTEHFSLASTDVETITISFTSSSISVNDYIIDATTVNGARMIAFSDDVVIFNNSSSPTNGVLINGSISSAATNLTEIVIDTTTNSITYSDTTINYTGELYYASESGDYGAFKYNSDIFRFNKDTVMFACSYQTGLNNAELSPSTVLLTGLFKGTYDNFEPVFSYSTTADTVYTSLSAILENVEKVDDICLTSKTNTDIKITGVTSVGEYTRSIGGNSYIVVPLEYTYYSDNNSMIIALLSVLPLILLIVPVMCAVGLITRRD